MPRPPGADRIRTAEARGVKVLIVEADDVAAVAPALEDAHRKGVRVLIIGGVTDQPTLPFATRVRFTCVEPAVERWYWLSATR